MFFPWRTDAPLYYKPWATIGLIVANVLMYAVIEHVCSDETLEQLILVYGHGLRPWQWLTGMFMHAGVLHLLGNMVFLWTFGLVIEGKIGWQRFLGCYLGIGTAQSALEQLCMLGADDGGSVGASAAITGIMAMACIWAPRNQVDCVLWLIYRPWAFELPMLAVVGIFIGWDLLDAIRGGWSMSSAMLHLSGAMLGAPVALLMLKRGWVECEGWDLLTIWKHGRPMSQRDIRQERALAEERAAREAGGPAPRRAPPKVDNSLACAEAEAAMRELIQAGDTAGAVRALEEAQRVCGRWDLPADLVSALARHHLAQRDWSQAAALLDESLRRFPGNAAEPTTRLALAQAYVDGLSRPAKALDVLKNVSDEHLDERLRPQLAQLRERATAAIAAGTLEIDD